MNKISDISVISAFVLTSLSQTVSAAEYIYIGSSGNAENTKTSYNDKIITNQDATDSDIFNAISTDRNGALNNSYDLSIQAILHNNYSNTGTIFNRRGSLTLNSGSSFYNNYASSYGGALYGSDKSTINIKGDSQFIGNEAENDGGAIYSFGTLNLDTSEGNIVFKDNRVGNIYNDISTASVGSTPVEINISGPGTVEIRGGINNIRQNKDAVINITNGNLDIKTAEIYSEELNFNGGANLCLTLGSSASGLDYGRIFADRVNFSGSNNNININVDINTYNGAETQTLKIIDGEFNGNFDNLISADGYNNLSGSDKYSITATETPGEFLFSRNTAEEVPDSQPAGSASIADAWLESGGFAENSAAYEIASGLLNTDTETRNRALETLAPDSRENVRLVNNEINREVINAVSESLRVGSAFAADGLAAGDKTLNRHRSWVKLLGNHARLSGRNGFSADMSGISMGVDKQIAPGLRLGAAYAYVSGNIGGRPRQTDLDSHTALLYGEYRPADWYVNAVASYGQTAYKETGNVAGIPLRAKYDVAATALQIMSGYDFGAFIPETGLRYTRYHHRGYRDSAGQNYGAYNTDLLTAVAGSRLRWRFSLSDEALVLPEIKTALTYDLTTPGQNTAVMLENGASYTVSSDPVSRLGFEVGAGLHFRIKQKIDFSIGYEGYFKDDYQSHNGVIKAEYRF